MRGQRGMKAIRTLAALVLVLAATALLMAVGLNFANIIGRYVLHTPIASAEEVMLFLFVASVFLGNSVVGWQGRQIRMPPRWRRSFDLLADLAVIAVSLTIIVIGWPAIEMLAEFDERSQAADIPMVIPQALIPIGLALNALLGAARLVAEFRGRRRERPPTEAF